MNTSYAMLFCLPSCVRSFSFLHIVPQKFENKRHFRKKMKKEDHHKTALQTVALRVYYRQTWIGTGNRGPSPSSEPRTVEGGRGPKARSPGSGDVNKSSGLRRALRYRGIRAAWRWPCKAGGTAEGQVFRPVTGVKGLLYSINCWRKLCTTRYRRI